ncbi:hypothetical protein DKM44_13060 [Deinococcus irradiatisoli]|uniref:SPOR domain-containing protein n=1 Tax=Deinococcus irradiatisoli TaxID=2202254 RepID=A0A2Z3JLA8_9DEIO|nr:hypothetical protein DKM44_13060 [Deinococcus irradiatisoli]
MLIGILIVVLALGLGSLLLTQRNRAATLPSEPSPPADTATIPSAPGTSEVTSTPAPTATEPTPPAATATSTAAPPSTTSTAAPTASAAEAPSTAASQPQATTSPAAPEAAPTASTSATTQPQTAQTPPASAAQQSQQNGPVPTGSVQAPVTPQPDTTAPPVATTPPASTEPSAAAPSSAAPVTPRSGGAVATSAERTPLKRDYRISLGTFGSVSEAEGSTKAVRALGYTVYPIDLGSQVVAQVGPFADAQTAGAALSDIQRVYGGAVVYAPRQSATGAAPSTSTPTSTAPATSAGSSASTPAASPTAQPAASPAPAPSGPVYLQVGAFDRQDSAQRLVGMLSDLGYSPSVQAPEGQKVRVLIGPFSGDAVVQAENKLNDNGFDHFRVR